MYKLQLKDEIREEDERAERDQVKAEQDLAYRETLEADMAKDAAKRQKEATIAAERKRIESEMAEQEAKRESIRLVVSIPYIKYTCICNVDFLNNLNFYLGSTITTARTLRLWY